MENKSKTNGKQFARRNDSGHYQLRENDDRE
jgi:hypothetical protein